MADLIADVAIRFNASPALAGVNRLDAGLKRLQNTGTTATKRLEGGFSRLGGKVKNLRSAFSSLQAGIAAVGLTAFAKTVGEAGVSADRTAKRIRALSDSAQEAAEIQAIASRSAKEFGIGNLSASNSVADLVGRLKPMGVSLSDIETVFIGANKAGAKMNLTSDAMSNVMLQLSQALGSGVLQGDEFRSISEQMPAILQAVADTMGVERSQLKELASQGKVTTQVLIGAMGKLREMNTVPPDSVKKFTAAMENFQVTVGQKLLPALTPVIEGLTLLLNAFSALPGPVQSLIVGVGALGAAVGILGPVIAGVVTFLGQVVPATAAIIGAFGGLGGALAAIKGLFVGVVAVLSGPVGIVAAIIAAGAAIFAFKDEIGAALQAVGSMFVALKDAMIGPFQAAADVIKGIFNSIIGTIEASINKLISFINAAIKKANRVTGVVGIPAIPEIGKIEISRFAEGGYVTGPTNALIGEAGQPEYVIPASKMNQAMNRYAAGARGEAVTAGAVAAGSTTNANYSSQQNMYYGGGGTSVNITTGPVIRMDNQDYVAMSDLQRGMSTAVGAAESNMMGRMSRSYSTRRSMGL